MGSVPPEIAMVLAAGRGSRLRPLTDAMPKPAVPLFGRPLVHRVFQVLRTQQLRELHINLWHLPDVLAEILTRENLPSSPLFTHVEEELLGTAGGVRNALGREPAGDVLVYNGDVLYLGDLSPLWARQEGEAPLAVLGLVRAAEEEIPRSVLMDRDGRISSFRNQDRAREDAWTFSGIQWISKSLFRSMPETGCLVADLYAQFLETGRVLGVPLDGYWVDVGTMDRLFEVHMALLGRPELLKWLRPELVQAMGSEGVAAHDTCILGEGVEIIPPCVLEAGVRVGAGAVVGPNVYLGTGAVVAANAELKNVAVLDAVVIGGARDHQVVWAEGSTNVSKTRLRGKP